jgi:hypothetical protein
MRSRLPVDAESTTHPTRASCGIANNPNDGHAILVDHDRR